MGYTVRSMGRVTLLSEPGEAMAAALRTAMLSEDGWLLPEDAVTSLSDLSPYACAAITAGSGTELTFMPLGDDHDAKWSAQASAFYQALTRYTVEGEIEFEGPQGDSWRYRYQHGVLLQEGRNGWDGTEQSATSPTAEPA